MQQEPPLRASLDSFLASVERRALRIAQVATRDRDEALDLVQDAMLRLARGYADRPAAEWPPLFHRILTNRIRDWQRNRKLRARLFFWRDDAEDEETFDPAARIADPDAAEGSGALEAEQALTSLEVALGRLPPRQREAFQLRVWEGLNVEATALAMNCSQGSVKTHLFRALQSLRASVGERLDVETSHDE